eukprot:Clim_evm57s11 gene=Clim_evmTU57s11
MSYALEGVYNAGATVARHIKNEYLMQYIEPDLEPLNPMDVAMLAEDLDCKNYFIINSYYLVEPKIKDVKILEHFLKERLLTRPGNERLQKKIVYRGATPYWKQAEDFDLWDHFFNVDGITSMEEFKDYMEEQIAKPLPMDKPLWQLHVINNFNETHSACFFRIHHVISDGLGLVKMTHDMLDEDVPMIDLGKFKHRAQPSGVFEAVKMIAYPLARGLSEYVRKLGCSADHSNLHGQRPITGRKRVGVSPTIDLAEIKAVGKSLGYSVNDVLFAILSQSISQYVDDDQTSMKLLVPVSMRDMKKDPALNNQFATIIVEMPLNCGSTDDTLKACKAVFDEMKSTAEIPLSYAMALGLARMLPHAVRDWVQADIVRKTTSNFTNVPGPQKTAHIDGRELKQLMFFPPLINSLAMGVSIYTYNGTAVCGMNVDDSLGIDPQDVMNTYKTNFEALYEREVGAKGSASVKAVAGSKAEAVGGK